MDSRPEVLGRHLGVKMPRSRMAEADASCQVSNTLFPQQAATRGSDDTGNNTTLNCTELLVSASQRLAIILRLCVTSRGTTGAQEAVTMRTVRWRSRRHHNLGLQLGPTRRTSPTRTHEARVKHEGGASASELTLRRPSLSRQQLAMTALPHLIAVLLCTLCVLGSPADVQRDYRSNHHFPIPVLDAFTIHDRGWAPSGNFSPENSLVYSTLKSQTVLTDINVSASAEVDVFALDSLPHLPYTLATGLLISSAIRIPDDIGGR